MARRVFAHPTFLDRTAVVVGAALLCMTTAGAGRADGPLPHLLIPPEYFVRMPQSTDGKLAVGVVADGFGFMMPDGTPTTHDYGMEGLPDYPADARSYVVVVNSVCFTEACIMADLPERRLANLLAGDYYKVGWPSGPLFYSEGELSLTDPSANKTWYNETFYYAKLPAPSGRTGNASILYRCPDIRVSDAPDQPSACDGWMYSGDLHAKLHIRLPKRKVQDLRLISTVAFDLIARFSHTGDGR